MKNYSITNSLFSVWKIMLPQQKRSAYKLFLLMFIGTLLETLGVGLIFPALAFLSGNFSINLPSALNTFTSIFSGLGELNLLLLGIGVLLVVYGLRTFVLAVIAYQQSKYVFDLRASISQRLFDYYLTQPYNFHLERNSATLLHTLTSKAGSVASISQQGLMVISEVLILIALLMMLVWMEPIGTIAIGLIFLAAAMTFGRATKGYLIRSGAELEKHDSMRLQRLQEGLGGSKEVKLLGRESEFIKRYSEHDIKSSRINSLQGAIQVLPRLFLEFLAVASLCLFVIIIVLQGKPMAVILPTIGLFGAAAFRLMPSVNRILGATASMRFSLPAVQLLVDEFKQPVLKQEITESLSLMPKGAIQLKDISYRYQGSESQVLKDINLEIPFGSCIGFIGGSGAGKSTLVDIMLGLLTPTNGNIYVGKKDIQLQLRSWQNIIGYVPQSIYLSDDTLRRNIAFGLADESIDDAAIRAALKAAQLNEFVEALPNGLHTLVGERGVRLSGGQRQRIGIARSLYHNPSILFLDEATSSLDVETEKGVMEAVNSMHGDKTIIIVAHRLSTVENCDYLYELNNGYIARHGMPSSILLASARSVK